VLDEPKKCSASVPDVGDNEMELDERTAPSDAGTSVVSEETNPESADSLAMEQQQQQQQQRPFTKQPSNEACSCGSGQRFKKCCGSAAAKKVARARQRKATMEGKTVDNAAVDGASGDDTAEQVMDGTFRVLHI
jgi:SEC-C motif